LTWIRTTLLVCFLIFTSCDIGEVPTASLGNPLDVEEAAQKGIDTPALVFFPDSVSTSTGSSVSLEVYALNVDNLGMAYLKINYDNSRLSLSSINPGEFLMSSQNPIFLYEDKSETGVIDIYTSFLGTDSASVSGTGNLAYLVFSTTTPGQSTLSYSTESELSDPDDNPIEVKGFGEGVIDAQ